jgi:hypothetical protein
MGLVFMAKLTILLLRGVPAGTHNTTAIEARSQNQLAETSNLQIYQIKPN